MKKPLIQICTVTFVVLAMALNGASAHGGAKRELRYEYHIGDASPACDDVKPTDDPIEVEPGPTCRQEAVAGINPMVPVVQGLPIQLQGGGSIAIQGAGELAVSRKGKPRHVDGGGTYAIFGPPIKRDNSGKPDLPGRLLESGSWRAKKLLQFDSYGPGKGFPPELSAWRAGRAIIKIHLRPRRGRKSDAILEVGCRLGPALLCWSPSCCFAPGSWPTAATRIGRRRRPCI